MPFEAGRDHAHVQMPRPVGWVAAVHAIQVINDCIPEGVAKQTQGFIQRLPNDSLIRQDSLGQPDSSKIQPIQIKGPACSFLLQRYKHRSFFHRHLFDKATARNSLSYELDRVKS